MNHLTLDLQLCSPGPTLVHPEGWTGPLGPPLANPMPNASSAAGSLDTVGNGGHSQAAVAQPQPATVSHSQSAKALTCSTTAP